MLYIHILNLIWSTRPSEDFFYVVRSGDFQIIIDDLVTGSLGRSAAAGVASSAMGYAPFLVVLVVNVNITRGKLLGKLENHRKTTEKCDLPLR